MNDLETILARMRSGELILENEPGYDRLYELFEQAMEVVAEMNSAYRSPQQIRDYLSRLTGRPVDASVRLFLPFHTAFGRFITLGRGVFINSCCTFLDRGGITLGDGVFVGPNVSLITENHPERPDLRHNVYARPIVVKDNAWIGAGAIVLPGVTIGCNSIVGAGAVVTHDVPDNVIVAGNPARFIREIER